jgi:uncharacterized protein YozE (UPF0346 family)
MAPSFVRYILKFKNSECPYGDVARDIKMDPDTNRNWGYKTFMKYLEDRGASDRCLAVVEELYQAYGAMQGKLYK